jgi:hypothetical protein
MTATLTLAHAPQNLDQDSVGKFGTVCAEDLLAPGELPMMDSSCRFIDTFVSAEWDAGLSGDDVLVTDDRSVLRPSEHVQGRLISMLRSVAVPVSCLHTRRDVRRVATA